MADNFEKFWLFLAVDKETDEALGSVSLSYELSVSGEEDENVYSVGFYFVRPDWRGIGLGHALFEKAMEIGRHANMVLHGGKY
ncbi:hypothetical protein OESDEN_18723 [Oesophagostomum dentatum]|uniref:N-acetyltransferase domain-containing protein n=1 Tax=Oesophagostomum dentatum TaxID=61180 RepID=A0A0B1SEG3_OESDE|nr:hypothetical protein OESDEN_18723 [Oesophagostomum dentatum]